MKKGQQLLKVKILSDVQCKPLISAPWRWFGGRSALWGRYYIVGITSDFGLSQSDQLSLSASVVKLAISVQSAVA